MQNIDPAFLIFEFMVYVLFILCFINAWKRGIGYLAELIGGLVFGVLLEYINANFIADYSFGRFFLMISNIPVCIGAGWAVIIYSSMALSDRTGMPVFARPFADAFLALNIDLSMDMIAIRIGGGMWVWGWDQSVRWTSEWFGVPYGNFFGWFFVVLLYSYMIRIGRDLLTHHKLNKAWKIILPFFSVLFSQIILIILVLIFYYFWPYGFPVALLLIIPCTALILIVSIKGKLNIQDKPDGFVIRAVPLVFHTFFLASIFVFRITAWNPWIVIVSIIMFLSGIAFQLRIRKHKFGFRNN